jgi:hypothetical protein
MSPRPFILFLLLSGLVDAIAIEVSGSEEAGWENSSDVEGFLLALFAVREQVLVEDDFP